MITEPDPPLAERVDEPLKSRWYALSWDLWTIVAICAAALYVTNQTACVLCPVLLIAFMGNWLLARIRMPWLAYLLAPLAIGAAVGWLLSISPDAAFKEAFGYAPPEGATMHWVQRHYLGGPGDYVSIIVFDADEDAYQTMLSMCPPREDWHSPPIEQWQAEGRPWNGILAAYARHVAQQAARTWRRLKPMRQPTILRLKPTGQYADFLLIIRDQDSNRCVVVHSRG